MKLKDVGFFQRHLEKLVLGAAGAFLLGIAGVYLIGDPYTVTLENRQLQPEEVPTYVRDRARELESRLADEEPLADIEEVAQVPELAPTFIAALRPEPSQFVMAPIGAGAMSPADFEPPIDPSEPYHVPSPPTPENVVARTGNAVLADRPSGMARGHYQSLLELVGNHEPRDFRYVSVDGEFNFDRWREQLEHPPEDADGLPLRRLWWARMIGAAGVYLQRQRYDPLTGEWGETSIVDPLPQPHQVAFKPEERVDWDREQGRRAIRFLRENQGMIQRPDFPPTRHASWRPPHLMPPPLEPEELSELRSVNSRIERHRRQISRIEQQIERRRGDVPPRLQDRLEREREGLEEELLNRDRLLGFDVDEELERFEQDRRAQRQQRRGGPGAGQWEEDPWEDAPVGREDEPWGDPAMDEPGRRAGGAARPGQRTQPDRGILAPWQEQAEEPATPADEQARREHIVRVWAHDLTVEPGATYRYRLIVSVLNPLFQQDRVPAEQRDQYHDRVALGPDEQTLAETDWTDPVRVSPDYRFFLVGGSAENEIAEVELWRIYDGRWRRGEFQVRPGDPIAGTAAIDLDDGRRVEVPMHADAVLVDLISSGAGGPLARGDGVRMVYFDQQHETMADRSVDEDEESIERLRLESEITLQQTLGHQARANGR